MRGFGGIGAKVKGFVGEGVLDVRGGEVLDIGEVIKSRERVVYHRWEWGF